MLTRLNDELAPDLLPGQFVTLFAGIFTPSKHLLKCALAGHHQLLLLNKDDDIMMSRVGSRGMALGIASGKVFAERLQPVDVVLRPGDMIVQYSDGLVEANHVSDGEMFDHHRFGALLLHEMGGDVGDMLRRVVEVHDQFTEGENDDDCTILALARLDDDASRSTKHSRLDAVELSDSDNVEEWFSGWGED